MSTVFLAQGFLKVFDIPQSFHLKEKTSKPCGSKAFLELLSGFEPLTSSLPKVPYRGFLFFCYSILLQLFLCFQRFHGFSVLFLSYLVASHLQGYFRIAQGFSQGFCNRTNRWWDENLELYRKTYPLIFSGSLSPIVFRYVARK